jgi:hypothetical protein
MANARFATAQAQEVRPALKRHRPHPPGPTIEQFWRGYDGAVSFSPTPNHDRMDRDLFECDGPPLEQIPTSMRRYNLLIARHIIFDIPPTSCNICISGTLLYFKQYKKFVIMLC